MGIPNMDKFWSLFWKLFGVSLLVALVIGVILGILQHSGAVIYSFSLCLIRRCLQKYGQLKALKMSTIYCASLNKLT
jgi:hypothetical protein